MKVLGRWLVNNDPDQAGALGLAAGCLLPVGSCCCLATSARALHFGCQTEDGLTADFSLCFWLRVGGLHCFFVRKHGALGCFPFLGGFWSHRRVYSSKNLLSWEAWAKGSKGGPAWFCCRTLLAGGECRSFLCGACRCACRRLEPIRAGLPCSSVGTQPPRGHFPSHSPS